MSKENTELKKAGLKATLPRIRILEALESDDNRHLSAEDIYKQLIASGEDVDQLVKGLSKDQVQYLLGTPLLNSPIHQSRWDYFYSVKVGETIVGEKKLSLIFDDDQRLDTWVLEQTSLGEN